MLPKTNPDVREIRDDKHFDAELLSRIPCDERDSSQHMLECLEILFY